MKRNMFKNLVIASVMTLSGAVLPAFAADRMHVTVPFSFMVGGAKMAAGDYNITQSDNGMVTLVGAKTSAMVLTVPTDYSRNGNTALGFTSSDSNQVLTTIQVSGSMGREIPLRTSERKAALASAR